jgi:hypothetical protein
VARLNSATPLPLQQLGAVRKDIPHSGVTFIPSLHNLTAPKAVRSRGQLFEALIKLSRLQESLLRISLSLHVGTISFCNAYYYASVLIQSPPTVPLPKE